MISVVKDYLVFMTEFESVVSDNLQNMTSDRQILHAHSHHSSVHMYLVVGLCKLGTTFHVNFEQQKNAFHFEFEEKKVLTLHGHALATLISQTTCCLRLGFAAPRGDLKK